jgi:hypothetical protein
MLNRKVCQRCYCEYRSKPCKDDRPEPSRENKAMIVKWGESYTFWCPYAEDYGYGSYMRLVMFITWPIPKSCPYVLEHTVSEPNSLYKWWVYFRLTCRSVYFMFRDFYKEVLRDG